MPRHENSPQNHSDSDDWTLVSPPESANSSSSSASHDQENVSPIALPSIPSATSTSTAARCREMTKKHRKDQSKQAGRLVARDSNSEKRGQTEQKEEEDLRASGSQDADDEEDDGLVEIDLNVDDEAKPAKSVPERVGQPSSRSKKGLKNVEFAPTSTAVLSQQQLQQTLAKIQEGWSSTQEKTSTETSTSMCSRSNELVRADEFTPERAQQIRAVSRRSNRTPSVNEYSFEYLAICFCSLLVLLMTVIVEVVFFNEYKQELLHVRKIINSDTDGVRPPLSKNSTSSKNHANKSNQFEWQEMFYFHPSDTANMELMLLDQDLEACINQMGFGWLGEDGKMYSSQTKSQKQDNQRGKSDQQRRFKPFRGLVCYERENEWRRRFKKLKDEFNIDLGKFLKQTYKRLADDLLTGLHPSLRFRLIINQLEYLEHLDEHRRAREMERLKAENLELRRRLASLNDDGRQAKADSKHRQAFETTFRSKGSSDGSVVAASLKALARLENENGQLKRENDALKASMVEKAGTVYIKQSMELEKCERENNELRRFHQQIAHEVASGLKQLDLDNIDAAALLNDHESLASQLALTRGYMIRLGEEIAKLIQTNADLRLEVEHFMDLLERMASAARRLSHESVDKQQTILETNAYQRNQLESHCGQESQTMPNDLFKMTVPAAMEPKPAAENKSASAEATACLLGAERQEVAEVAATGPSDDSQNVAPSSPVDSSGGWLMRRAKLRERLRKSSGIDVLERHIDRLLDESKNLYKTKSTTSETREKKSRNEYQHSHDSKKEWHHHRKHSHKYPNHNSQQRQQPVDKSDSLIRNQNNHYKKYQKHLKTRDTARLERTSLLEHC